MRIALAQLNYTIGAFDDNVEKIIRAIRKGRQEKAALVVFSELASMWLSSARFTRIQVLY